MRYSSNLPGTWKSSLLRPEKFSGWSETKNILVTDHTEISEIWNGMPGHAWTMARFPATGCKPRLTDHSAFHVQASAWATQLTVWSFPNHKLFPIVLLRRSLTTHLSAILKYSMWLFIESDSQITNSLSRLSLSVLSLLGFFWDYFIEVPI